MVRFDRLEPEAGTLLNSSEVRDNFQALERANELRVVPGTEVDPGRPLALFVESGNYAVDGQSTKAFTGDFSSDLVAPIVNPRIDVLSISLGGALGFQTGVESVSPTVPPYPADSTPLAEITLPVGVTDLADPAVTIRDVRPMFVISAAGFGINPSEEAFVATASQTVFTLTLFSYSVGSSELQISVDGTNQHITIDYLETGVNEITFLTPLQVGANVNIWRVGAASAHTLSDLDDVDVPTAEAVTDPLNNRPNAASGNNPFATLTDVSGAVPFDTEHNAFTGVHGPKVTITQTANDNALLIDKQGVGSGSVIDITNAGIAPSILVTQNSNAIALDINKTNTGNARVVTINNSGSGVALEVTQDGNRDAVNIIQNAAGDGLMVTSNGSGNCIEAVNNGTDAAMIITQNTAENAIQVSKTNTGIGILLAMTNAGTGNTIRIIQDGTGVALNIAKTGTGRSINVAQTNATEAVNIANVGTGAALQISGATTDMIVVGAPNAGVIDPLWGGGASDADSFHTHGSIPTLLSDLSDVSSDEADAFNNANAPTIANVFATIADLVGIKVDTYTGDGAGGGQSIVVGFQPDWVVLYNDDDNTQSPVLVARNGFGRFMRTSGTPDITITATGFDVGDATGPLNAVGDDYMYIAIKANQ